MLNSRVRTLVFAAVTTLASAGIAQAATITQAAFTDGTSTATSGGFTATAGAGTAFQHKTFGSPSATGVGINGPVVPGEITGGESITITSNIGQQQLTTFEVAFLFPLGSENDAVNEIALLGLSGPASTITLTATGFTSATLTGATGTIQNISPGDVSTGAGEWLVTLTSPVFFNSVVFQPGDGGATSPQGDFAFVSMTTAVPEPATWAMMILGFMGVGFMAYRRKGNGPSLRLV